MSFVPVYSYSRHIYWRACAAATTKKKLFVLKTTPSYRDAVLHGWAQWWHQQRFKPWGHKLGCRQEPLKTVWLIKEEKVVEAGTHHVSAWILTHCVSAGNGEKASELPKGDCGVLPSFPRSVVAVVASNLLSSKQRHSLGLGERFRKAAASSNFPRRHLNQIWLSGPSIWENFVIPIRRGFCTACSGSNSSGT